MIDSALRSPSVAGLRDHDTPVSRILFYDLARLYYTVPAVICLVMSLLSLTSILPRFVFGKTYGGPGLN